MISHHMSVVGMGFIDKIEARNANPAFKARIVVITVIRLHSLLLLVQSLWGIEI